MLVVQVEERDEVVDSLFGDVAFVSEEFGKFYGMFSS